MDTIIFVLKVIVLLVMCFILARMLAYLKLQLTYYYHSRHIERFLEKKRMSAEKHIEENSFIWRRNFAKAPYLRGGGTRAFVWSLLCRAREDIAIRNFERIEGLSLHCFSCYFSPRCPIKYHLTCAFCLNADECQKRQDGREWICGKFMCNTRIVND